MAGSRYWPLRMRTSWAERISLGRAVEPQREQRHRPVVGHGDRLAAVLHRRPDARSCRSSRISRLDAERAAQLVDAVDLGGDERDLRRAGRTMPSDPRARPPRVVRRQVAASRTRRRRRRSRAGRRGGTGSGRGSAGRRRPARRTRRARRRRPRAAGARGRAGTRARARRRRPRRAGTGSRRISPSRRGAVIGTFCRPVTRPSSCAPSRVSVSDHSGSPVTIASAANQITGAAAASAAAAGAVALARVARGSPGTRPRTATPPAEQAGEAEPDRARARRPSAAWPRCERASTRTT